MNCIKCNNPLKPGAKFCTSCGTKVVVEQTPVANNMCKSCGKELKEGAKFCTGCGTKVQQAAPVAPATPSPQQADVQPQQSQSKVDIIKNKLVWNVQPGEVAKVITESEFNNYKDVIGLIVNEGTKALVRLNGEVVAEISSGSYDFVDTQKLNEELEAETNPSTTNRCWSFISNIFRLGKKESEKKSVSDLVKRMDNGAIFSVILVLDIPFKLIYGANQNTPDDYKQFIPMHIETSSVDIDLGLSLLFKISDIREFAKRYMLDKSTISTTMLVSETSALISAGVKRVLSSFTIDSNKLPQEAVTQIEEHIKSLCNDTLYGLTLVKVVEVAISSEDLDRFRTISQELYLTERELGYLQRTNDFKNRLTDIENSQAIHEATTDLELHRRLESINRDKLLSDEEMKKFYLLLSRERKIREAKSEDEIAAALQDIERTQLLRDEDLAVLKSQLATNAHTRGFALEMMQLKDSITYQKTLKVAEYDMQRDLVAAEIEQKRLQDDYTDERFRKQLSREKEAREAALDLKRREAEQTLDIEERKADRQMNDFMRMAELKRNMQSQSHKEEMEREEIRLAQEREMERLKNERESDMRDKAQNMSAEQLMALAANDNLDAEAAREFARSFSAGRDKAEARESAEKLDQINQARVDDIKEMMRMMMESNVAMNSNMAQVKENNYRETKERLTVEQQRLDRTQDRALDYTTRNNMGAPVQAVAQPQVATQPAPTPTPQSKSIVEGNMCPHCGVMAEAGALFCENCGSEI